ncbi:CHAT domain-containing protein [Thermomonospora umbrina]|uniref:CHAT domain-containing protein n=1 Tax=Thermomonospora umbrina TaxID=111806 RepID=A0A3D9SHN6_9ACTN|nr:CHAT domain-containing protein [Thermomonospora umbrina]REE95428.1 CHAT domain-containing protein [Thermomonospora umbrina]
MTDELLRLATADPGRAHTAATVALTGPYDRPPRTVIVLRRAAALAAKELGRLDEGLDHLTEALRVAERAGLGDEQARVRMNLVGLQTARGDLAAALASADAAEGLLNGADADRLAANRACALARAGRLDEAEAAVAEALPRLRRGEDPATLVGLLINLGLARALRGDPTAGEASLVEAADVADRAGLPAQAAMARGNLAFAVSRRGDLPRALRLYAAAEPGLTGERLVQCRMDQAETLIAAGLTGEARPMLARALAEASARGYRCDVADGLLLLAHAELAAGDAEQATHTAERARAGFAAQNRTGWMLLAEHLLLRARWAAGDRSPAFLSTAVAAADRLAAGGWAEPAADTRITAARLALHLGRPARPLLEQVGRARRRGPAALRVAAWHATALERHESGDLRGALAAVRAGLRVADEYAEVFGAAELRVRAAGVGGDLAELGLTLARTPRELLAAEERRRAMARRTDAVRPPADPVRARALAELRAASADHATATARGDHPAATAARLSGLESAIRAAARRRSPPAGRTSRPIPCRVPALVDALGERAFIELIRVGAELHAVTITAGRCRRWSLGPYDRATHTARHLRYAVRRLAHRTDEVGRNGLRHAARDLAALIPPSLRRALGDRDLVLAPTGPLHTAPWSAVIDQPLTVVPSATAWLYAVAHDRPRGPVPAPTDTYGADVVPPTLEPADAYGADRVPTTLKPSHAHGADRVPTTLAPADACGVDGVRPRTTQAYGVGAGGVPGVPGSGLVVLAAGPDLAEAHAEVTDVARLYPGALVLTGAEAHAEAVRRALDGAELAHVAAHGEFRGNNPFFSHLRMADGPLVAYDIEDLPTAPRLVVLSACDVGQASDGDGVLGIVGVLLGLGAATVIASVAPVQDTSARTFMTAFHGRLREGLTPSQALASVPRSAGDYGFVCFGAG